MYLKSIMLKGFKSFPDRTQLTFGPGVSVIVGPNGSGKSNITDAVLWALGEQSALAVRGQTMQDVIFAGSEVARSRSSADVEIVIDNSDGHLNSEFSELAITRHIDRSGEGVYRLNGARCRLVDVMEVLSDSGLGKEMHSVISQGRVEGIIHSKPVDRTALIEEAAGLSKHRKRRRRAQLKLERTQDNLDRALDVEREARSRLRPLKRQAEAAELHARLERQGLELRGRITQESLRLVREELSAAESAAAQARRRRDELEAEQSAVAQRREQAERSLAQHGHDREQLSSRLYAARSAAERISIRLESVSATEGSISSRLERARRLLDQPSPEQEAGGGRLTELEGELEQLERERDSRLASELADVESERREAEAQSARLAGEGDARAAELEQAETAVGQARQRLREATDREQAAARAQAGLEVELERLIARQRLTGAGTGPSLADAIKVDDGYESAAAAALGGRLSAQLAEDLPNAARTVAGRGDQGGRALVMGGGAPRTAGKPPLPGARRLLDHLHADDGIRELLVRLLADAWVVERIEGLPDNFEGIAVTLDGTSYHGAMRQLRRMPAGGAQDALAARTRREEVEAELGRASAELERARSEHEQAGGQLASGEQQREQLEAELRELRRQREEQLERARRAAWLIEQRRELGSGPGDLRRRELAGQVEVERRLAETLARGQAEQAARRRRVEASAERDEALLPAAGRLVGALEQALAATRDRLSELEQALQADEAVGEQQAAELRRLAQSEYELQARLREASEALTQEEVRVAQIRDRESATSAELTGISQRLGGEIEDQGPLGEEERIEVEARLERLERRRERIGPVNPLAESEYKDAIEHVEELEGQRKDLEAALSELRGLIRETDRRIREAFEETFEIAARNFEEMVQHLFPGGRGKLRLVKPQRPRVVLGGAEAPEEEPVAEEGLGAAAEPGAGEGAAESVAETAEPKDETPGVEIEVTPAGKSTKRLSLLSGGEKSLVALGFLFAVFLARPCPFYILDEVEAALDDRNIDRFLDLVRRYSERSQFIVITHQRRTMEAADVLYGVSMSSDGISKVVSRRLGDGGSDEGEQASDDSAQEPAGESQERLTEAA
jgi:chromosome segregation protein